LLSYPAFGVGLSGRGSSEYIHVALVQHPCSDKPAPKAKSVSYFAFFLKTGYAVTLNVYIIINV
jgi:hypothetical protein